MRFFFLYPYTARPAGGLKQIRLFSQLLQQLGADVHLLRESVTDIQGNTFDDNIYYNLPIKEAPFGFDEAGKYLSAEDILILPEYGLDQSLDKAKDFPSRIGVNNQNGFYAFYYRPRPRDLCARIEFSMACSPFAATTSHHCYGLDWNTIFHTPYWMVRPPFDIRPTTSPPSLAVCYMPRKIAQISEEVMKQVKSYFPSVPWIAIDGLPENAVAETLRANQIFFSAQDEEGFGMPALEAMICGCLVAGFGGTRRFPHPYASRKNGFWANDLNVNAAAKAVCKAIILAREKGPKYQLLLKNAQATASQFSREKAIEALQECSAL